MTKLGWGFVAWGLGFEALGLGFEVSGLGFEALVLIGVRVRGFGANWG